MICAFHLFFVQNGLLLMRYTYLSNDSSYSVSQEDGVEILLVESDINSSENSPKNMDEFFYTSDASDAVQSGASEVQSYSFEAQVNFSFYVDSGTPFSFVNLNVAL